MSRKVSVLHKKLRQVRYDMIRCCYDEKRSDYSRYGGRGIRVCERWLQSLDNFIEDMGPSYKLGLTLDREDNMGNYELSNCRWTTINQQARNTRTNRFFIINGERKTLAEWIESCGLNSSTVKQRFYVYKWPIERALGIGGY